MTPFETYLVETHHKLNELGLFHYLIGSSLLGAVREGHALTGDIEVNFGVFAEDLTDKMLHSLRELYQVDVRPSKEKNGITFLIDKGYDIKEMWHHPVGFTALQPMYQKAGHFYYSLFDEHACDWPIEFARTMRPVEYLGEQIFAPYPYEKWLELYYGSEWHTPNGDWAWFKDARNYINWTELQNKIQHELTIE